MQYMTLVPAYGRDYKTAKAVKEDWALGKDFLVANIMDEHDGKPFNKQDAATIAQFQGPVTLNIRYKGLANIAQVKVTP